MQRPHDPSELSAAREVITRLHLQAIPPKEIPQGEGAVPSYVLRIPALVRRGEDRLQEVKSEKRVGRGERQAPVLVQVPGHVGDKAPGASTCSMISPATTKSNLRSKHTVVASPETTSYPRRRNSPTSDSRMSSPRMDRALRARCLCSQEPAVSIRALWSAHPTSSTVFPSTKRARNS